MQKTVFISYATNGFEYMRDELCESALSVGFNQVEALSERDLDSEFRRKNEFILSQKRGGGYWLWKPQIIIQELSKLNKNDVLVYCDAGRSPYYQLKLFPRSLIQRARKSGFIPGVAIHQHGPLSRWAKRDAFVILNADSEDMHTRPVIQAGYSFWTPTAEAFSFLEAWRNICENPACLTDQANIHGLPNLPNFIAHRHDQSINSILCAQYDAPYLDFRSTGVFRILALRPQSGLAHYFLRRIDDAETLASGEKVLLKALVSCYLEYKKIK